MTKKYLAIISLSLLSSTSFAQIQNLDKIIGRVGNSIILKSDINTLFEQEKQNNFNLKESDKCAYLYEAMVQQVLVAQAERDSVIVTEDEVNQKLEERIQMFLNQAGSKEVLEARAGKSIYQIKEENRKFFRDDLTAKKMQQQILANIKVTPFEVQEFYASFHPDSLMPMPATVEVGQIVIHPKPSQEMEDYAKGRLEGIRKDIVEGGKNFSFMAGIYGMDGTKNNGGELVIEKGKVDPIFLSAAMKLQPGEVSPVFRGKFGYHIVQMIKKTSNTTAKVRHIIIIPEITKADIEKTTVLMDSVKNLLDSGKLTFAQAVNQFTTDEGAKMTGGMVMDYNTGSSSLPLEALDATMAISVNKMKVGEFSHVHTFQDPTNGQTAARVFFVKSKTEPHLLNLKDDYAMIQEKALSKKKYEYLKKYVQLQIPNYYIYLDPEFSNCESLDPWLKYVSK